tara:strand:- start:5869 stop:6579 length:711 start_codon:yes stop_codon:yes gene_type:complete
MKESWNKLLNEYNRNNNDNNGNNNNNDSEDLQKIIEKIESKREELKNKSEIYPKRENLFKCFNYFEIQELKVVIIGQDPYHGPNQATGLCFAVESKKKIPPSLKNISNELYNDLNIKLEDFTLETWAKQGILLMNCAFSVIQGKPGSQMKIWNNFTNYIISELNKLDNIIFVAWGAFAYEKFKNIDCSKHYLIVSSHPSPLSYFKPFKEFPPFKGSKPFSKINNKLIEYNKTIINW